MRQIFALRRQTKRRDSVFGKRQAGHFKCPLTPMCQKSDRSGSKKKLAPTQPYAARGRYDPVSTCDCAQFQQVPRHFIGGLIRRTDVLASVSEMQHGQAFWLVFTARVLTNPFNRHPMRGGTKITCGVQHAHRECVGADREKTLHCRIWSRRAVSNARDGGGTSNQRATLCATLQSAPDHCAQLGRLLSGRSYRWKLRR